MIEAIEIINFRSIKHEKVRLPQFCAVVGKNGAGKTNLIQAINFIVRLSRGFGVDHAARMITLFLKELFHEPRTKQFEIILTLRIKDDLFKFELGIELSNGNAPASIKVVRESLTQIDEQHDSQKAVYRRESNSIKDGDDNDVPFNFDDDKLALSIYEDKQGKVSSVRSFLRRMRICDLDNVDLTIPISKLSSQKTLTGLVGSLRHKKSENYEQFVEVTKKLLPSFTSFEEISSPQEASEDDREYMIFLQESGLREKLSTQSWSRGDLLTVYIIALAFHIPPRSTLIVEEIENSLHTGRTKDLLHRLNHVVIKRDLQMLFTTHSPIVVNDMKPSEVLFVQKKADKGSEYLFLSSNEMSSKISKFIDAGGQLKEYLDNL